MNNRPSMAGFFDQELNRRASESIKWNLFPEDVLPMWVADMDFRSPEPVISAIQARVAQGVLGYPADLPELKQAIIQWLFRHYAWEVHPDEIVLTPGVVVGLEMAVHAIGEPGDGVLMQTPVYHPFLSAPDCAGRTKVEAPLSLGSDGRYFIDFDRFEDAITARTRLMILCNPHNPVGRVFRQEELERLAEICLRHNVVLCSDEIHSDLVYPGHQHIPLATLSPDIARHTITLMAPSKTFNIAGLCSSFAVIQDKELREQFQAGSKGLVGHVNLLGQVAAEAAYRSGQEWLDELLVYLQANVDYLTEFVHKELPGIEMTAPEGTYLAWLDCRKLDLPEEPGEFFLKHARVALNNGSMFGTGGRGFVRLNFGCPRSMLSEALDRMRQAIRS